MSNIILAFDIGIKNLSVAAVSQSTTSPTTAIIHAWRLLPLMPEERKTKPPQEQLMLTLFNHLDELVEELEDSEAGAVGTEGTEGTEGTGSLEVIIENQPRCNGVMKTVQTWIQTYFMLRKHWALGMQAVASVHLVSAKQKLVGHDHEPIGAKGEVGSYRWNKTAAVAITQAYIGSGLQWYCEMFDKSKKKDDLADALLHAIAWMRRQGKMVGECSGVL
jgi:hypothetical protein